MNMSSRSKAIAAIGARPIDLPDRNPDSGIDFYGADVFNTDAIVEYLPRPTAKKLLATVRNGEPIDAEIAADVAHGMKKWAIDHGATHYTHWFLPLTGSTAEKHDSFIEPDGDKAIMTFSAKNLIIGEPDASSFPSGGLRSTFEARGYTAWDPTSPAFIKRHANGATLCIPTVFCSYTGIALDKKTPMLRSCVALRKATKRLMKAFGLPEERVSITLGAEQEYFLIDKMFYLQRPDLLQTGRTLFGAPPPKHQQLEDHYFGSIRQRILKFMTEVEKELWRLGIPAKTRHNEVAPAQFELAPMFESANLAVDHNMLIMEVLRQVAERNGLVCLLHEKPFAGVNGSGKHNNWSFCYGDTNLLQPGNDPEQNAIFLTVLSAIIMAVDKYSDLLFASVASAGNSHRLGANEAPPAIISIYLGDQLNEIIEQLQNGSKMSSRKATSLRIGIDTLPPLPCDATDRNRTSPFAFTGNKFEFRAPGSSQSCAGPMMVLNTIVADAVDEIAAKVETFKTKTFNEELQKLLKEVIIKHKRIIFNGDNYSGEWRKEAVRRGLPMAKNAVEGLCALTTRSSVELFEKHGVFTAKELASRCDVFVHEFERKIRIEGGITLEMVRNMIMPVVTEQFNQALHAMQNAQALGVKSGFTALSSRVAMLGEGLDGIDKKSAALEKALDKNDADAIVKGMNELRPIVDRMEGIVCDGDWPLPKYREMLFIY
jgi:glutamine synthetase